MIRTRFHGRGGRYNGMGDVLQSAGVFASALLLEGKIAQTTPLFSSGRWGAPVTAFLRVDSSTIYERGAIENPDYVIVFDRALMRIAKPTQGLKPDGTLIINAASTDVGIAKNAKFHVAAVNVSSISGNHKLSPRLVSLQNLAMLGAVARITGLVGLPALEKAIRNSDAGPDNLIEPAIAGARDLYRASDS